MKNNNNLFTSKLESQPLSLNISYIVDWSDWKVLQSILNRVEFIFVYPMLTLYAILYIKNMYSLKVLFEPEKCCLLCFYFYLRLFTVYMYEGRESWRPIGCLPFHLKTGQNVWCLFALHAMYCKQQFDDISDDTISTPLYPTWPICLFTVQLSHKFKCQHIWEASTMIFF